jgi:hypothetical protein
VGILWFCTEIGQFIEERSRIGQEPLFWPLWCCVCIMLFLATQLLDARREQEKRDASPGSNPPVLPEPPLRSQTEEAQPPERQPRDATLRS